MGPPEPAVVAATVLLLLSRVEPACGSEDIVVGCGGFVKSDVEINYSLIEVSARPAARNGFRPRQRNRIRVCPPASNKWKTAQTFRGLQTEVWEEGRSSQGPAGRPPQMEGGEAKAARI